MRRNIRRTGKGKAAAIGLAMILGMTGCAGKETAPENVSAKAGMQEEQEKKVVEQKEAEGRLEDAQGADSPDSAAEESKVPEKEEYTLTASQGTEHLGGKVQDPQADGMTFAQTTLLDEEGMVTLLDVEDAKKIPVKFTEDTKIEHWIIQGGGAEIDMQEAAVSDLKEGMSVELEGYFDGETFVATKVIMEDYV